MDQKTKAVIDMYASLSIQKSALSIPIAKSMLTPQQIADAMVTTESIRITVDH